MGAAVSKSIGFTAISSGIQTLSQQLPGYSETYSKLALRLFYKFVGEPQAEEVITEIFHQGVKNQHETSTNNSHI